MLLPDAFIFQRGTILLPTPASRFIGSSADSRYGGFACLLLRASEPCRYVAEDEKT